MAKEVKVPKARVQPPCPIHWKERTELIHTTCSLTYMHGLCHANAHVHNKQTNKQTSVLKNQRLWMKNTCPLLGYLTVTWASPFLDTDYSEP